MITPHTNGRCAFTIVETMFSIAIASVMLVGILTSYVFAVRGFYGLSHYSEVHQEGRHAMDMFARDARMAANVSTWTSGELVLAIPSAFNNVGQPVATNFVSHSVSNGVWIRHNRTSNTKKSLADDIESIAFDIYDRADVRTSIASHAVSVEVSATAQKSLMGRAQQQDTFSGRLRMRNME